ncbi:MAG: hypothetical protein Q7S01_04175 [bacterium]|nr:hypothetical protein [bacterium]
MNQEYGDGDKKDIERKDDRQEDKGNDRKPENKPGSQDAKTKEANIPVSG